MSSEDSKPSSPTENNVSASQTANELHQPNRSELVQKARIFLQSPQVRDADYAAKRRFLVEKGLDNNEIDTLLRETISQPPAIPPRTYPQPPPSNLPNLLIGLARIVSWVAGGSVAFLLLYFRYIYPRLVRSFQARLSLQQHQKGLLDRLNASLLELKTTQSEAFVDLPRLPLYKEDLQYKDCHSLDALGELTEDVRDIPGLTLLRCAVEELTTKGEAVTTDAIFSVLESKWPWLQSDEGSIYAAKLWDTLTTVPLFEQETKEDSTVWSYTPPAPSPPPPIETSLSALQAALPPPRSPPTSFQHALQSLADFTGYIAAQTYAIPSTLRFPGIGVNAPLPSAEEDVRREIRALKGLVLNRRSFLPNVPKPSVESASS